MNLSELRQAALDDLQERDMTRFKKSTLDRWINDGYRKVCTKTGCLQRLLSFTTSEPAIALPSDFYRADRLSITDGNGNSYPMDVGFIDDLNISTNGLPERYVIYGGNIYLIPIPDGKYSGTMMYKAYPQPLLLDTDAPEIPDMYHTMLALYATAQGMVQDQKVTEGTAFLAEYNAMVTELGDTVGQKDGIYTVREL